MEYVRKRVASLGGVTLVFVATVVVELAALAFVTATAGAVSTPMTVPVTAGFALSITSLPKGTHSLTAIIHPQGPSGLCSVDVVTDAADG
ncbi:MAG TPA: hypothetical protein VFO16_12740 [Pseudonocardiaceae bacterium]|nr:hypothetical protein [Pseudonocardiaceae bacterium]